MSDQTSEPFVQFEPLRGQLVVWFTFQQHLARARENGCCPRPQPYKCKCYDYPGWDYAVPIGSQVWAVRAGLWQWHDQGDKGYGKYIIIDHGHGVTTRYAHLSSINVAETLYHDAGDLIGLSGSTGNSTGPHLHFECRVNDIPVDPYTLEWPYIPVPPKPVVHGGKKYLVFRKMFEKWPGRGRRRG